MDTPLLLAKTTVVLMGAWATGLAWRRSPRRVHQMWTLVFAAVVALPYFADLLPVLKVPMRAAWIEPHATEPPSRLREAARVRAVDDAIPEIVRFEMSPPSVLEPVASATRRTIPDATMIALGFWLAGTTVAAGLMLLSLWRVRRLTRCAVEIRDPLWLEQVAEISRRLRLPRTVRLLESDCIDTPMAGEVWRPTIFLPAGARAWTAACRQAVLAHEVAHLAGHDPLRHLAARVMLAIYWFHPLAWIAARLDANACEDTCDETVVRELGIRPSSYASVLLELAAGGRPTPFRAMALPAAHASSLERRLMKILDGRSRPTRGRLPVPAVVCGLLAAVVGSAQPDARVRQESGASQTTAEPLVASPVADHELPTPMADVAAPRMSGAASGQRPLRYGASMCGPEIALGRLAGGSARVRPVAPGGLTMTEVVGSNGFTRAMQRSFGDLRTCLLVEEVPGASMQAPSTMLRATVRAVLEAEYAGTLQQLEISRRPGGRARTTFAVNGVERPADGAVLEWQHRMLSVLDLTWELTRLRGRRPLAARLEALRHDELTQLLRAVEAFGSRVPAAVGAQAVTESACDLTSPPLFPSGGASAVPPSGARPRFLRETFGDLQLCVRIDAGNVFETIRPSELMRTARSSVLETRRGDQVRQFVLTRDDSGIERHGWWVNGLPIPIDAAALTWKARLVDLLDTSWQIWALRGQEGLLNGRIGMIQGELATRDIRQRDADAAIDAIRSELDALHVDERIADWSVEQASQLERFRTAMSSVQ